MPAVTMASPISDTAHHRLGLVLVAAATLAWSTAGFFSRLIPVDTWTMQFWRGLFGAVFIALFLAVQSRGRLVTEFVRIGRPGWLVAACSAVGMIVFLAALRRTSVADVSIIYAACPFVAAALGWVVLRERPTRATLLATAAVTAGVAVMVGGATAGGLIGDLLAFVMTINVAVMAVVLRRHRDVPMGAAACGSALISVLLCLPFAQPFAVGGRDLWFLAAFGITQMGLGLLCFTLGARFLPPAENALIGTLDAPLAPFWVWLAFSEVPTRATVLGGAIVLAAVVGQLWADRRRA